MANTYVWTIDKLFTKNITVGGTTYTDVVVRIEATLTGTSGDDNSITKTHEVNLDMNTSGIGESFTAYDNITEANAISWVEARQTPEVIAEVKKYMDNLMTFDINIKDAVEKTGFPWA
jgi:hypothetical protein